MPIINVRKNVCDLCGDHVVLDKLPKGWRMITVEDSQMERAYTDKLVCCGCIAQLTNATPGTAE